MKIQVKTDKKESKEFFKFLERNPELVLGICVALVAMFAFVVILFK